MELHSPASRNPCWPTAGGASSRTTAGELLRTNRTILCAHRGYSGIAPENTLPAFMAALEVGVDFVELDYHHSADGIGIVIHDETLDRTTDAQVRWGSPGIRVASRTAAELAQLDAGAWFGAPFAGTRLSTLAEALDVIDPGAMTLIERKAGDAATLVHLLGARNLIERVIVQSFDWHFLADCRQLAPNLIVVHWGGRS